MNCRKVSGKACCSLTGVGPEPAGDTELPGIRHISPRFVFWKLLHLKRDKKDDNITFFERKHSRRANMKRCNRHVGSLKKIRIRSALSRDPKSCLRSSESEPESCRIRKDFPTFVKCRARVGQTPARFPLVWINKAVFGTTN